VKAQYQKNEKDTQPKIGERIIRYFIGRYVKIRYKIWMFRKEANESKLNPQDLHRICSDHILPVTYPLALISQIQGSGGSFLSQLFDGHPELHAHPHELMIGYPEINVWPQIDLNDRPERWFGILFEDIVSEFNREGYKRGLKDNETFPFIFIPSLQREIFLKYLDSVQFITLRDVFDAYMTSYFGAWLSNQNYNGPKKFVTAYTPRLAMVKENMELFFEVYPDGRLISLVRDPKNWFSFVKRHWPRRYGDVLRAATEWNETAQAVLCNKERYGDFFCLIGFEDLVSNTETVMRYLAKFLGIKFDDILLAPTFNKFPLEPNTSFYLENHGIVDSPLSTERTLTGLEVDTIERMTGEAYRLVLKEVVRFG
jgi:hypothetical protein